MTAAAKNSKNTPTIDSLPNLLIALFLPNVSNFCHRYGDQLVQYSFTMQLLVLVISEFGTFGRVLNATIMPKMAVL
jgi:hypothetical protein